MSKRASRAASPAALAKQVRTLYIQVSLFRMKGCTELICYTIMKMEYVGGMDLKEAIENGVTEVDVWRQMVRHLSSP